MEHDETHGECAVDRREVGVLSNPVVERLVLIRHRRAWRAHRSLRRCLLSRSRGGLACGSLGSGGGLFRLGLFRLWSISLSEKHPV